MPADKWSQQIKQKLLSNDFAEFCRHRGIKLAVLFGSRAQGKAGPDSDWDIALLLEKHFLPGQDREMSKTKRVLLRDLCAFLETSQVDMVILNLASSVLKYQVARTGRPLYQKNNSSFAEFASLALRQHEDARLFYELEKAYLKKSIKGFLQGEG